MKFLFSIGILFVIVVVVVVPLIFLWCVETIWVVEIQYTFKTWFAALIFCMILGSSATTRGNK
jgi:hypothetical protein